MQDDLIPGSLTTSAETLVSNKVAFTGTVVLGHAELFEVHHSPHYGHQEMLPIRPQ